MTTGQTCGCCGRKLKTPWTIGKVIEWGGFWLMFAFTLFVVVTVIAGLFT